MHCLLALLRFSLCAWVGAATLFVITGIREVTSPEIAPATKNLLASIRFPAYYVFGFTLVVLAAVCAAALRGKVRPASRGTTIVALLAIVLLLMIGDYVFVFQPLMDLMDLPDARDDPEFTTYHNWSKYVNFASVGLCLVTAVLALHDPGLETPADQKLQESSS
jgi:hypothetical protein